MFIRGLAGSGDGAAGGLCVLTLPSVHFHQARRSHLGSARLLPSDASSLTDRSKSFYVRVGQAIAPDMQPRGCGPMLRSLMRALRPGLRKLTHLCCTAGSILADFFIVVPPIANAHRSQAEMSRPERPHECAASSLPREDTLTPGVPGDISGVTWSLPLLSLPFRSALLPPPSPSFFATFSFTSTAIASMKANFYSKLLS